VFGFGGRADEDVDAFFRRQTADIERV
jgi:hypothetical protein